MSAEEKSPEPDCPPIISKPMTREDRNGLDLSPPWLKKTSKETVSGALASPFTSRRTAHLVPVINTSDVDDVFSEVQKGSKRESEEDKKLLDWVMNVFVPACKNLLDQCSEEPVITEKVQTYLRLLGNTINFFCNEHQSPIVSPSRSFSGLSESSSRDTTPAPPDVFLSPPASQPTVTKAETDSSVAIKVLRSVSSSLLPPLQNESSEGFTKALHRKIVVAIQKISWKVEACLSYSLTSSTYNVHKAIFDDRQIESISGMMIAAPPEEHKLQNSPAHVSRLVMTGAAPSPLRFNHSVGAYPLTTTKFCPTPSPTPPQQQEDDDYFRPKATRRTTVSISKLQVQNLGLNMVDVATLDNSSQPRSNTIGISTAAMLVQDDGVMKLQAVREKVLRKLAKEFPQLKSQEEDVRRGVSLMELREPLPSPCEVEEPFNSTPLTLSPNLSYGSPSYIKEPSSRFTFDKHSPSPLRERTQSLEFDQIPEATSSATSSPFHHSVSDSRMLESSRMSEPPEKGTSTMPTKRRGTIMRIIRKGRKVKSFGQADIKTKVRPAVRSRNKSASEFFRLDQDESGSGSDPIEVYSRGAYPSDSPGRDFVYLNIEVQNKASLTSPRRRKFSVSGAKVNRSSLMLDINIATNFPEFELQEYTISRSFKDLVTLYDIFISTTVAANTLPQRPEKKSRDWKQQAESFLSFVAQSQELRTVPEFMEFIRPGEMSAILANSIQKDSEFELLMTFYTPITYKSGEPGTHHNVEMLKDIAAPAAATSSRKRWNYPSLSNGKGSVMIERQEGEEVTTFVIREGEKDALIITETQNRFLIVAGTFEKLVEQLACEEKPDPHYVSTFLLGYRHFASSVDLVTLLIKRFQMTVAPDASDEEIAYAEKWRYVIQLRVLDILSFWIKSCFSDFLLHAEALEKLRDFIELLHQSEDGNFSSAAARLSSTLSDKVDSYHSRRSQCMSTSSSPQSPGTSPYHSLSRSLSSSGKDINSFSAIQLARQLTLMELDYLKAIDVYEVALYTWETGDETKQFRRNLDAYIARFNEVSFWVASEILSLDDEKARASLIEKFIDIAKHCQELRNFNTTVSLVTGLSLTSVRRLSKTWKHVNERLVKSFTKMRLLVNPANNHHDYRKAFSALTAASSSRDACIPYFGVFMRDVTLCNYGNPKKLKNGLYNFSKLRLLVQMFEEIYQYQRSKYYHPSDDRTQAFCSNLWSFDEHQLYEQSLKLEPREQSIICESD